MSTVEQKEFKAILASQSDESLQRTVALLEDSVARQEQELARLTQKLTETRQELAFAQEAYAARPGLQDPATRARWTQLLSTLNQAKDRFTELQEALYAAASHEKAPMLMSSCSVRQDNRQTVLALLVPANPESLHKLYLVLLQLMPLLVNESNPDEKAQAAVLDILARNISDKESLTLVAHPAKGRYELLRAWRSRDEVEHKTPDLRSMLQYVSEKHAYHG
jgi:hypothetical protein